MMSRETSALMWIKDSHRTIEVACFLRLTLLRLTDRASRFSNVGRRPLSG
jgi:hypothetical protein